VGQSSGAPLDPASPRWRAHRRRPVDTRRPVFYDRPAARGGCQPGHGERV